MFALLFLNGAVMIVAAILQCLLYFEKDTEKVGIYFANMLYAMMLMGIAYTSLPSNYESRQVMVLVVGLLSVFAVVLKTTDVEKTAYTELARMLLTLSIAGNIIQLII